MARAVERWQPAPTIFDRWRTAVWKAQNEAVPAFLLSTGSPRYGSAPQRLFALAVLTSLFPISLAATAPLGLDLSGRPVEQLAPSSTRAVVLFFAATDCPIANRYVPEITQLARDEEHAGVVVWFVYPNPGDTADAVRAHRAEYAIPGNVILDTQHALVRMAHATVTPEAAVFVPDGNSLREVYRGRIDDRYAGLGQERPRAMHHDLEDAVHAVLAGQPVPAPAGKPVGCAIMPLGATSPNR